MAIAPILTERLAVNIGEFKQVLPPVTLLMLLTLLALGFFVSLKTYFLG